MKTLYMFLILNVFSVLSYSQELNFEDMWYIFQNQKDLAKCDTYLAEKKFYFKEKKGDNLVFAYHLVKDGKALAFLAILEEMIQLQSVERATFDYFKQAVVNYGYPQVRSGIDDLGFMFFSYGAGNLLIVLRQGNGLYLITFGWVQRDS